MKFKNFMIFPHVCMCMYLGEVNGSTMKTKWKI